MADTHNQRPTTPRAPTTRAGDTPEIRGRSPQRPIRIPDDAWYPAIARAKSEDRPIGHIVTEMLRAYVAGDQ